MGGSESKTETNTKIREKISTELTMKINNVNKNLNKSVTEITTNISNKVVNKMENSTEARALAENLLENIVIVAEKGSKVNVTQDASAKLEMVAIIQMLTDTDIKNNAATELVQDITAKLQQDATAKAELMEAARIEEKSKEAKGFANMVENLTNMAGNIVGGITGKSESSKSNTDIEKEIRTAINNEISNTNINENEVINRIATTMKNEFLNLTVDECLGSAESRNQSKKMNLGAFEGSEITVLQIAKTEAVAKCMVNRGIGNKAFSGVTNDSAFKAASDSSQAAKSDAKLEKTSEQIKSTETTDAIADTVQTGIKEIGGVVGGFTMILPIIIGIAVLGFVAFMFMGGGDILSDMIGGGNINEMEGGAIAIHTLQRAIILVAMVGGIDYIAKQFNKYK